MAFDIEKMKADGVSSHLIELASMSQETFLLLIARRLEHDKIFQQFMGQNAGSIEAMYSYAVAAGLMSEYDRLWLIDEDNPYKPQGGEVWYTGTLSSECGSFGKSAELLATDKANTADLASHPNDYSVSLNGTELIYLDDAHMYADGTDETNFTMYFQVMIEEETEIAIAEIKCPTDITTVEVTISHK